MKSIICVAGLSLNQPKLCPTASWNPNGTTFANISIVGPSPRDFFISTNNTIYLASRVDRQVKIWFEGNTSVAGSISVGMDSPYSIFVSLNGDIFVDNGAWNQRVDRWTPTLTNNTKVMSTNGICHGLFIDDDGYLYCSMDPSDRVVRSSSNSLTNVSTAVAGNGSRGSDSIMLNQSRGIFVDTNFTLFVADCGNDRVQRFLVCQLTGTISLWCPTEVILDLDSYLFIADQHHNQIVGERPQGFRCIVGCSRVPGPAPDQMTRPHSLSFDTDRNLFVLEEGNGRIQKFLFERSSCDDDDDQQSTEMTSTSEQQG